MPEEESAQAPARRTQPGGSAAINGFLYQMLHHIAWIASVRLTVRDPGIKRLVLEPRNGGDARAERRGFACVEQYKARTSGTWSLRDVMAVLRDLRRGVQARTSDTRYRFVTDGRRGRLDAFDEFLERVRCAQTPDKLDKAIVRKFSNDISMSDRAFFDHIESETRRKDALATKKESSAAFFLLSHFEMKFDVSADGLECRLDNELRRYVAELGAESGVRERLVGALMTRLAGGEATLDRVAIDGLLREVGLSPDRVRRVGELATTMATFTSERLARLGYDPQRDVRNIPIWPPDKQVLLIAGESGVGKTWQLGRLLQSLADEGRVVTLVPDGHTSDDPLKYAAREIWQRGLRETSDKTIIALSNHLRDLNDPTGGVVIAFDDIRDASIARRLVSQDWTALGMRLVLTVPDIVARSLHGESAAYVHTVGDFSTIELRDMLAAHSHDWAELPHDLALLLRKPILAGIFIQLGHASFPTSPQSEYEIFERFWRRIMQRGHAYDEDSVLALGMQVREGKSYPIPRRSWSEVGLAPDVVERLETAGWLSNDGGSASFAHDRLLNWAVAKSFGHSVSSREMSATELGDALADVAKGTVTGPSRLSYVPMDVLWLLAEDPANADALCDFVEHLERSGEFGSYGASLYVHLLPTLGERAIPILITRLQRIPECEARDYQFKLIGVAFAALAEQNGVELRKPLLDLLESPSEDVQNVALHALAKARTSDGLDRIWALHKKRLAHLTAQRDMDASSDYQTTFAALRAGIAQDPSWLRNRLVSGEEVPANLPELAYQLSALDHPVAQDIWEKASGMLIERVPPTKPRSLLNCIGRFADEARVDFVLQHLTRADDFASGAALSALTAIDPAKSIERLADLDDFQLYAIRNRWLPVLLYHEPDGTRQRLLELAEADSRSFMRISELFHDRPNQIDEHLLRFLLRTLESELDRHKEAAASGEPIWLSRRLEFLSRIVRPELLAVLEAEAGGHLERMIADVACGQLEATPEGSFGQIHESARRVLLAMGGDGFAYVLRRQLTSTRLAVRLAALDWAVVCEDAKVIPVILDAATSQEEAPLESTEFQASVSALAQLGADGALVEVIESMGRVEVPTSLAGLRSGSGPMPKELTANATQALASADAPENSVISALLVAWVSGDPDMIRPVREKLRTVRPESPVALYACLALGGLGDTSEDFAELASPMLLHDRCARIALSALAKAGDNGHRHIVQWLHAQPRAQYGPLEVAGIRLLHRNPSTRETAVELACDACRARSLLDLPFEIAGEAIDEHLRERLMEVAFDPDPLNSVHSLRAIEGLAKFDVVAAVRAAQQALQGTQSLDRRLCLLVAKIARESAARVLTDIAVTTKRTVLRRWIGHALRQLDSDEVSEQLVSRLLDGNSSERQAIADVARWLPTHRIAEALADCATGDRNMEVRLAALSAIAAHQDEAMILLLREELATGDRKRQWRLLVSILEAGNPHLLSDPGDNLGLGDVLLSLPRTFRVYAYEALNRRLQQADQKDSTQDSHERTTLP